MQRFATKAGLATGHKQPRPDSFSGDISDRDAPASTLQGEEVVVVTANAVSGLVEGLAGKAWNGQSIGRKKCLLNILRALQIPANRSVKSGIGFRFLEKLDNRLHVIAQQESGFSRSPFLKSVDDGLVRFNYVGKIA